MLIIQTNINKTLRLGYFLSVAYKTITLVAVMKYNTGHFYEVGIFNSF